MRRSAHSAVRHRLAGGNAPPGIKGVIRSTTLFAFAISRTQIFAADDMPDVVAVQRGYRTEPLSTFLRQPAPPAAPEIRRPRVDADLAKHHFFDCLAFALQFNPPQPNEAAIRAQLACIGRAPRRLRCCPSAAAPGSRRRS